MKPHILLLFLVLGCHSRDRRVVIDQLFAGKATFAVIDGTGSEELWRIDKTGSATWKRPLSCGAGGDVVSDGTTVAVRCLGDNDHKQIDHVAVYDADDGHELWSHDEETGPVGPFGQIMRATPGGLLVRRPGLATLYDQTGKARLIYPTDSVHGPLVDGRDLIFLGAKTSVIDPVEGTGLGGPSLIGCVQRGEVVQLKRGNDLAKTAFSNLASEPRIEHIASLPKAVMDACGTYGKDRIFELNGETLHVVRVADDGTVIHDIDLGAPDRADTPLDGSWPDVARLNGNLPRYNVMPVSDGSRSHLVLIDLEDGKVVWRGADEPLVQTNIFRASGYWIVSDGDAVRTFNAVTGERNAVHVAGASTLTPNDVSADRIWLHGVVPTIDAPSIAILDLHLKPLYARGIAISATTQPADASSDTRSHE